jgi:uncharacterized protein YbaP (TraB family)
LACQSKKNAVPDGSLEENGLLWKISGNGLEQSSYLFGTYHGSFGVCLDILDSIPGFYDAFNSVTQYAGETDANSANMDVYKKSLGKQWMPRDTSYRDILNEKDLQFLDSILLKHIHCKSDRVNITPNYLGLVLNQVMEFSPDSSGKCNQVIDVYLRKKANENGCIIKGLDIPDILSQAIDTLYASMPKSLVESANNLILGLKAEVNQDLTITTKNMENAYKNQDLWALEQFKNEQIIQIKQMTETLNLQVFNFDWSYDFFTEGTESKMAGTNSGHDGPTACFYWGRCATFVR